MVDKKIEVPEQLVKELHDQAVELHPLMDFFVSVCVSKRYKEAMKPVLRCFFDRYKWSPQRIACSA